MISPNATIDTLMTPIRHSVAPGDLISAADTEMRASGVHHLVVLDGGRLVGIISALDVLRVPLGERATRTVETAMSDSVDTIAPTAKIREAIDRIANATFSALPVVTGGGEVIGIVTTTDLERLLYSDH